jgi:hypothetical protein
MAIDVFVLSSPGEAWSKIAEGLVEPMVAKAKGRNVGFHEGNELTLNTGEFFRSIGVPEQHSWLVEVIRQWCSEQNRASGTIEGSVFHSTLGSFSQDQYDVRKPSNRRGGTRR